MSCTSCGLPGVEGSCSMCYGELDYGGCTALREEMERDQQRAAEEREWEDRCEAEREAMARDAEAMEAEALEAGEML